MSIRAFIAISLSKEIKDKLEICMEDLKKKISGNIQWIKSESFHITLKFLGDISTDAVTDIKNIMEQVLEQEKPFTFSVGKLGVFPNIRTPRVILANVDDPEKKISIVQHKLEKTLEKLGIEIEEKEFNPHITLGRIKDRNPLANLDSIINEYKDIKFGSTTSNKVILFRSELKKTGAVYIPLTEVNLK